MIIIKVKLFKLAMAMSFYRKRTRHTQYTTNGEATHARVNKKIIKKLTHI